MNSGVKRTLCLIAFLLVSACGPGSMFHCASLKDWGVESLGLTVPAPPPFDTSRLDLVAIAPHYRRAVAVIAAVAGARYAEVQTYFDQLAARPGLPAQFEGASGLMFAVQGCGLYLLSATRDWVAARPDSKAAQFMLGVMYAQAASEAHGGRYASQTSNAQSDLFE